MSKCYYKIATGDDDFYDLPAPSMTEPGDMLIVSAVRGELPPPPDGWQTPQHRDRIYDAPPRLQHYLPLTRIPPEKDFAAAFRAKIDTILAAPPTPYNIPIEMFQPMIDAMRNAVEAFGNISAVCFNQRQQLAILDAYDPYSPTKSARKAAAFTERHARHVERRRARIVGQLGRVQG